MLVCGVGSGRVWVHKCTVCGECGVSVLFLTVPSTFLRIAQSTRDGNTYEVYNRRFFSDWSRSGALAQLSEAITLYSNKTYMLQGVMKEDSGVDFMKASYSSSFSLIVYKVTHSFISL